MTCPWLAEFRPPRRVDAVTWLEENVRLPEGGAGAGGKWRRETLPYAAGVVEAAAALSTRRLTVKKSAQSGLTTAVPLHLWLLHRNAAPPVLWVAPTTMQVQTFCKGAVADLLRRTPALAGVVNAARRRGEPGSSLLTKLAPNGAAWTFAVAKSPNSYAALSVAVTVMDDADRAPAAVAEEGDPVHLISMRTTAWPSPLCCFISTPVLANGRIETLYAASDARKFFVRCAACGQQADTSFSDTSCFHVVFDNHEARTARLRCPKCGHDVEEHAWR